MLDWIFRVGLGLQRNAHPFAAGDEINTRIRNEANLPMELINLRK